MLGRKTNRVNSLVAPRERVDLPIAIDSTRELAQLSTPASHATAGKRRVRDGVWAQTGNRTMWPLLASTDRRGRWAQAGMRALQVLAAATHERRVRDDIWAQADVPPMLPLLPRGAGF